MDTERWRRIESLFLQTLDQHDEKRSDFLDEQCRDDPSLRHEVERLVAADARAAERVDGAIGRAMRSFHDVLPAGTRLGRYEIVGRLAEGGMGTVFRARRSDDVFVKDVAIKVVKRGMESEEAFRRFQRERRILARLEHPGIARILDGGSTEEGLPYLVMELVDGCNVIDFAAARRLDVSARLRLFCDICDAVEYAHQSRIVHRDLKPGNIFIDAHGRPRLLDFGIAGLLGRGDASVTVQGGGILTPLYASPEQVRAEPVTPRSDVYSLGAILFELLTGRTVHRFAGDSLAEIVRAVCDDDVLPPSQAAREAVRDGQAVPVPPEALQGGIDRVVLMALEKDPGRRYISVAAFADDIRHCLASEQVSAPGARPWAGLVRRWQRNHARIAIVAASVVALALVGVYLTRSEVSPPPNKVMLAVLPFENLMGDDTQQPFVDGLHEEIISRLGRLQPARLGVIARSSVLDYRNKGRSIDAIARELGAHYFLECSVRQAGQRVRVTAQFVQVNDRTQLWSQTFERPIDDVFSVQTEIAGRIADSLQLEILPAARAAIDRHEQLRPEIYAAYLRGKYYWHRRWVDFPANAERARDRFLEVIGAAPEYPDAYAALGQTYQYLSARPMPQAERDILLEKARAALTRALALDPEDAAAHAARAWISFRNEWQWTNAEREFREALRLDSNNADIHHQFATLLAYTDRSEEADRELRLALELDPLSPTLHVMAYYAYGSMRRWERAEQAANQVAELIPGDTRAVHFISALYALKGNCQAALETLDRLAATVMEPEPGTFAEEHVGGWVLGRCGRAAEARRIAAALEERPYFANRIGVVYAGLGDFDRALTWLEESVRRREETATSILTDPKLEALRNEPRFQRLLATVGFPGH